MNASIKFTNEWLKGYVEHVYTKLYGKNFASDVAIRWDSRLHAVGGRTRSITLMNRTKPLEIDINENVMKKHPQFLYGTVGHELTHYECIVTDKPFRESNRYFRNLIHKEHLPLYLMVDDDPKRYAYYCSKCHYICLSKGKFRIRRVCPNDNRPLKCIGRFQAKGAWFNGTGGDAVMEVVKAHIARVTERRAEERKARRDAKAERATAKVGQMSLF